VSAFSALAREALRDAARRRALVAAAVASAIAGLAIARCGNCEANLVVQGQALSAQQAGDLGAASAMIGIALIALWTYAVAALLASDGLAAALEDGVAEAVLARPVSRDAFVLARLSGVWLGAFALGAALLALATAVSAPGVALLPALRAALGLAVGSWSVAALAMVVSLSLPRAATLLLSGALGIAVVGIEVAALLGAPMSGLAGVVAHYGPAWVAGPVGSLAPWFSELRLPSPPEWPQARAIAWAVLATGALVTRFRRLELPR
jgi:hypothetical protein